MSGRTKGSDLPLGREHLSPHRLPRPRLLGRVPPRSRRYAHAPTCPAPPCRLGHARALTSTLAVNHVFALTHTVGRVCRTSCSDSPRGSLAGILPRPTVALNAGDAAADLARNENRERRAEASVRRGEASRTTRPLLESPPPLPALAHSLPPPALLSR